MRRILALVLLLVAGCKREHEVRVLLGPDETKLSVGFRCEDDTGMPLMMRAGAAGHFAIVIDGSTISGGTPGCRSEDLVTACVGTGRCQRSQGRYCVDVDLKDINFNVADPAGSLQRLNDYIRAQQPTIIANAPDELTIVRAIATTAYCADIDGMTPMQLADTLVGCAYSCPVLLDHVDGTLSLSLDTLDKRCETTVRQCALFPNIPKL